LGTFLCIAPVPEASAEPDPYCAGISHITVAAGAPFDALVWYPTAAAEVTWDTDGFSLPATHDARIAPGPFPIVLLSHGGGVGGGKPLIFRELSSALARQGFVVIAPFHRTSRLLQRSFQIREALDEVTADPRFKPHVDAPRLGMLGFSLGTAVTLTLAGATPDFAHLDAYCDAHPTGRDVLRRRPWWQWSQHLRAAGWPGWPHHSLATRNCRPSQALTSSLSMPAHRACKLPRPRYAKIRRVLTEPPSTPSSKG
jgi:predicted dienelactone hydrolase